MASGFLDGIDPNAQFQNMTLARGVTHAPDEAAKEIIRKLLVRVNSVRQEHEVFRQWCDRADKLYFADTVLNSGADLWPEHESAKINGRQHVSVNLPAAYVDIPAALQAVEPIENVLATDTTPEARTAAAAVERIYTAWKQEEEFDLKWHKAIMTKGLYGRTAARVYWDADQDDGKGRVCVEVIQQPRNLFMGFKTDSFEELEWAAYRLYYEPNALTEEFGVEVHPFREDDGSVVPYVTQNSWDDIPARPFMAMGDARVEVWDYWYRQPVWKGQKFVRMDTYNVVIAGNVVIRGPLKYSEYKGQLPYIPLYNTFVPGLPNGRPDLYDVEPLIREKMERITSGSQMIANVTGGDSFQLTGPDAPIRVPAGLKPIKNGIVAPGPGNRIEVITPFIAQFQLEQFLGRIDRELAVISGLNELLLGLAPAQVLSSSKAINALIAQFEARLSLRRKLLYQWRRNVWKMALSIMLVKVKGEAGAGIKAAVRGGGGYLEILDPSLNPRDDMETMTRAVNAINNKVASQRTAMNWIGIDDPETEQDMIREERTDATMFPADVQVMAQLLGALQSLGLQTPGNVQGQAQAQMGSGQEALRQALGGSQNTTASQGMGAQAENPAIPGLPPEAQPGNASGAGALVSPPDNQPILQGMIQGGQAKGRIMTQQKLGRR
jgi:hypothetical protein